ncbi:hypothetical protein C8Q73DRAFT_354042 [Cubamyces lactineus]|nr:hypothetical protein C8Q73DRAFT_354042 [Cubamyces lactineus]
MHGIIDQRAVSLAVTRLPITMLALHTRFLLLLGIASVAHAAATSHLGSPPSSRQEQSSACDEQSAQGAIMVLDASSRRSGPIGVVSRELGNEGVLTIFNTDNHGSIIPAEALQVKLHHHCDPTKPFTIEALNPKDTSVRDVGGAVGYWSTPNFATSDSRQTHYAWITQTGPVPRGPVQRVTNIYSNPLRGEAESTIWTLQEGQESPWGPILIPSWVNTDNSTADPSRISLVYSARARGLAMTDNVEGFAHAEYKYRDAQPVEFVFKSFGRDQDPWGFL